MNTYILIVFVHVAAAVVLLGTSILGEPAVRAAIRRANEPAALRALLAIGRPMAVISPVAALLILASGIYLTSVSRFWSLGWVQVAVDFWIANALLAARVMKPAIARLAAQVNRTTASFIEADVDVLRWSAAWTVGVDIMAANDAAMLYLMVLKPGLGGSLAVVLIANVVVAGIRLAAGLKRPRALPSSVASAD